MTPLTSSSTQCADPRGAAKSGTNLDQGAEAAKVKIDDYPLNWGLVRGNGSGRRESNPHGQIGRLGLCH